MEESLVRFVRSLVEQDVFGRAGFVSLEPDEEAGLNFQFSSSVSVLKVTLETGDGREGVPIIVKTQHGDEYLRRVRNTAAMFDNEVTMYNEILPFLNNSGNTRLYPKPYYCKSTQGKDYKGDVLVLHNMTHFGFTMGERKLFLDFEHIALALRRIAQFHSWSYVAKRRNPEKMIKLQNKLKEIVGIKDDTHDFESFNFVSMKRGIEPFLIKGEEVQTLSDFLRIVDEVFKVRKFLSDPDDPFSVFLHGDFCTNNVLFKYDSKKGSPSECVFFDFQFSKYGSPAVDLSFFLYMHTSKDMREEHWDDFLDIYWKALVDDMPEDIAMPSFQEFLGHFAKRAVFGYFPCSFFVPMMLQDKPHSLANMTIEEKNTYAGSIAGGKGLEAIVNIVSHLLERKYIQSFINFYKQTHE